jgi:uncharacterized protein (DUF433 family)
MTTEELKGIIHSDPEIMGGTPVFVGTRIPLQNLIDALEGGESIEDFLEGFPSVKRSQAIAVIEAGQLKMLETVGHARWPTLEGRLNQPLTSRVEAVRQLQTTMPITPVAQGVLKRNDNGPSAINLR